MARLIRACRGAGVAMTKRDELVKRLVGELEASGLSVDEQIKALGEVRAKVTRPFRAAVKFTGPIEKRKKAARGA